MRDRELIPLDEPLLGEAELEYVSEVIRSGWVSSAGPFVERFEQAFAAYLGVPHAISCSSGTVALMLALRALEIGPGDEVILPTLTFSADAFVVEERGATPVFADCAPNRFTIDPDDVARRLSPRTRAVIPTHLYGHPADLDALLAVCATANIPLIEDAAQAIGAEYRGRKTGSIGRLNVFSFRNKLITTGEGGMLTTDDDELATRLVELKSPSPMNDTDFAGISLNGRLSSLHAALGVAQLERLEQTIARKRAIAARYDAGLASCPGVTVLPADPNTRTVYWRYSVLLDAELDRDAVIARCRDAGFMARGVYTPLHRHARYAEAWREVALPEAERMSRLGLDLPSSVKLSDAEVDRVVAGLRAAVAASARHEGRA